MVCLQIPVPKKRSLPKAKFPKGRPQFPQGAFGSLGPYHPPPPTLPLLSASSNLISQPLARYYCFIYKNFKLLYESLCLHRVHSFRQFWSNTPRYCRLFPHGNRRLSRDCTFVFVFPRVDPGKIKDPTLKKKKIKFSSYMRKFRVEQLQSHI